MFLRIVDDARPNKLGQKVKKEGVADCRNPLIFLVGGTGFEPVTSTV